MECQARYAVLMGGAGSGKSVAACQKIIWRMINEDGQRVLIVRKFATTLYHSVYRLLEEQVQAMGLATYFKFMKAEMSIKMPGRKNEIILKGLDDQEKIKSIQGITSVWVEEATELEERDFNQLELRVRGHSRHYKQFILSFNPIDEGHWLRARFAEGKADDIFFLKTTYLDNRYLDDAYIQHLSERLRSNENLYRIYALGEWGRANLGGEFYKHFRFGSHVSKCYYQPALPLHISFDFNVNPYMTCTIWQINDTHACQIDEICLASPHNTTRAICREFMRRYPAYGDGLFIYGDPSGRRQDTRNGNGWNDFSIILQELAQYSPQLRVPASAPAVAARGNFINSIFQQQFGGISILIDENCRNTIADYNNLKEASDGAKLKEKARNPDTGVSYEKYGHCSDANDYLICAAFAREYELYRNGGPRKVPYIIGSRQVNGGRRI